MIENAGGYCLAPLHTARLIADPLAMLRGLAARHGPTFELTLLNGPSIVTGDPAFVETIFGDPDLVDAPNELARPLVGDGSIVLSSGARHRRKRKLLAPPLHGARMRAYGRIIAEATEQAIGRAAAGDLVDALDMSQRVSFEVILRAVFGITDAARREQVRAAIVAAGDRLPTWLLFLTPLHRRFGGVGPWARYDDALVAMKRLFEGEITRARAAPDGRDDILALLLSTRDEDGLPMGEEELIDELRTLVIAGHETTATTMTWALWELHRHPEILGALRAELGRLAAPVAEDLSAAPLLGAVCDETLRMHPITPLLRRRLTRAARVGGHDLRAGTILSPAVLITHYDATIFDGPDAFRPARFLDHQYTTSEFMPFGGGNRRCIGAAFARFELQVALGTLLQGHTFSLASSSSLRSVMRGITTRPSGPVTLRVEARTRDSVRLSS